jgi:hypothetical protein
MANPGLPLSAKELELLRTRVVRCRMKAEDLRLLTQDEIEAAVTALQTT